MSHYAIGFYVIISAYPVVIGQDTFHKEYARTFPLTSQYNHQVNVNQTAVELVYKCNIAQLLNYRCICEKEQSRFTVPQGLVEQSPLQQQVL